MEESTKQEIAKNLSKITDLVVEPIKQRTAHPFISSYIISCFLINWKAFACLIFSSKILEEKIAYIDNSLYPDGNSKTLGIVLPFIIALAYTVGLKWLDIIIDAVNNIPIRYQIKNRADIKVNTLEAEILIVEAQIKLNNARAENKELQELNNKIISLQQDLDTKEGLINENVNETGRLNEIISSLTKQISKLKVDQKEMTLETIQTIDLKNNFESLINIILKELDDESLLEALNNVSEAKLPASLKNIVNSYYKKNRYKSMYVYKIALIYNLTNKDQTNLLDELITIDKRIALEKTIDFRGGKEVYTLEVMYPEEFQFEDVKHVVDKYVTKSL